MRLVDSIYFRHFCSIAICLLILIPARAQQFQNIDLDGVVTGPSVLPMGWQNVPWSDPNCQAGGSPRDTPDLTDTAGPYASGGVNGNPYSGNTFVSGLYIEHPGMLFHEGIMQTVSGFNPGCTYSVNFFQAVVKQISAPTLDSSGSWAVYMDNTLIGITAPTVSHEPGNSNSFPWEFRSLSFQPTSTTHTIKFLPHDDDSIHAYIVSDYAGLRMGIDSIYLSQGTGTMNLLMADTSICLGDTITLSVSGIYGNYLWSNGSSQPTLAITEPGTYWVEVSDPCFTYLDSIVVSPAVTPNVLGSDTTLCTGDSLLLNPKSSSAPYVWQDGTVTKSYLVSHPGKYWVTSVTACGTASDTIEISGISSPSIRLPHDTLLCQGSAFTLEVPASTNQYLWSDQSNGLSIAVYRSGIYWVQASNDCGMDSDSIMVSVEDCSCAPIVPSAFTPNGDQLNDLFRPVVNCNLDEYTMQVYNRWGELVFETTDPMTGWDGKFNGKPATMGVYMYLLTYESANNKRERATGNITLLK